jgi:hypothetical protein
MNPSRDLCNRVAARYKRGKARAIGVIAQGLINKARSGDTTSMIFFLKTQAGWRETGRLEHLLPEEAAEAPRTDAVARLMERLDAIAGRQAATPGLPDCQPQPTAIGRDAEDVP